MLNKILVRDSTFRNVVKEQVFRIYLDEERTDFTSMKQGSSAPGIISTDFLTYHLLLYTMI